MWPVYICDRNGQLYTGITTDLDQRMRSTGQSFSMLSLTATSTTPPAGNARSKAGAARRSSTSFGVAGELALNGVKGVLPAEPSGLW